jgi:hypothetical protein
MHVWLSLEALAASFAMSGVFCADAALAKQKRKNPGIVPDCRLLIAAPVLRLEADSDSEATDPDLMLPRS